LIRALPSIVSSIGASVRSLTAGGAGAVSIARTERDTPTGVLVGGSLAIIAFITFIPAFEMNLLGAILILFLGFLFSVVSSRITGEVGSSSCPLSGMTIGVLMATCGVFLLVGWDGSSYARLALMVGAVVCIAISNAGTCSQDLKTGFLVGSTPVRQQGALLLGVLASVVAIGWTTYGMNLSYTQEYRVRAPFAVPDALLARADTVDSRVDPKTSYLFVRLSGRDIPEGAEIERAQGEAAAAGETNKTTIEKAPEGNYLVDAATHKAVYKREDGIGSGRLQAPQAKLMSVVIDGLLTHNLPWNLILLGAAIAMFVELLGIRSLTFAVGVYLPLSSTMPVFLGGLARFLSDRFRKREPDAEDEPEGVLWCSGLIAGASIVGILAAMQAFLPGFDKESGLYPPLAILSHLPTADSDLFGVAVLGLLMFLIYRGAAPRRGAA
jgi:uncharacterized oligopeptide transporter (OPT) family protein